MTDERGELFTGEAMGADVWEAFEAQRLEMIDRALAIIEAYNETLGDVK
jgi:hypothetical protein